MKNINLKELHPGVREKNLVAFEESIGGRLPVGYRSFLLMCNGARPESNQFEIPGASNHSCVNDFLGTDEILDDLRKGRLPKGMLPIAWAEGGNLVCIRISDGSVIFWDHELEDDVNIFEISCSFESFLSMLRPFDSGSVELDPDDVESVWVDPDFKPKF